MDLVAGMTQIRGHGDDLIDAYVARPTTEGTFPGVVVAHHMPGLDEWSFEVTRRLAHHGYIAICPNLHYRSGPGSLDVVVQRVRENGGLVDEIVLGDIEASLFYLKSDQLLAKKVGIIGFCSGGRVAYLASAKIGGFDAAVDCWGGNVIPAPERITASQPVSPIEMTEQINCPILGIFGNDDINPDPDQVNRIEIELKKFGKEFEFHRYDGAGHGFFNWGSSNYRPEQSEHGWQKIFEFWEKTLV